MQATNNIHQNLVMLILGQSFYWKTRSQNMIYLYWEFSNSNTWLIQMEIDGPCDLETARANSNWNRWSLWLRHSEVRLYYKIVSKLFFIWLLEIQSNLSMKGIQKVSFIYRLIFYGLFFNGENEAALYTLICYIEVPFKAALTVTFSVLALSISQFTLWSQKHTWKIL